MIEAKRRRRAVARLALALMVMVCTLGAIIAIAVAEDETEATTFGRDGIATNGLGLHYEETGFSNLAVRADGGLVAQQDDQVEYFLADGTPDPAVPPQRVPRGRQVVPLAGGKSLIIEGNKLTRVNSDGSVDTSFGGGTVRTRESARTAAELASGQILLISTPVFSKQTSTLISVGLVSPDGTLDPATGENASSVSINEYGGLGAGRVAIAPSADGGALVSGDGFLLALRPDGSLNQGFGEDGVVDGLPSLIGARVLADGSVAAVGSDARPDGNSDLVVLRYTSAGAPDTGFGPDGIRRFDLGGVEEAQDALWAADDSVIVGGSARSPGPCVEGSSCEDVPMLAAFDPGGDLDHDFGSDGVLRLSALAAPSEYSPRSDVEDLARRPDGSIVVAGSAPPKWTTAFLAAVSAEGALLTGFGEGGIVRERQPVPARQWITGIESLQDGKLLSAGTTDVGVDESAVLVRYAVDGGLDRSFGAGAGYVIVDKARNAHGLAIDSGRVLTSTYAYPRSRLLELRLADGAPEPSFGAGGVVLLPKRVSVEALAFAPDGGAIVVGTRRDAGEAEPGVVLRYSPRGELDRGFGKNGRVGLRTPGGREVRAKALAVGRGGRILVGGVSEGRFAVARLLPAGRPDPRFGTGGWALTRRAGAWALASREGFVRSLALVRSGSHVYLAGVVRDGGVRVVLLRFKANGRPDSSFGRGGRRTASISMAAEPKAIVPRRGGGVVVLSQGPKPLIFFGRGKVRRRSVGLPSPFVSNVRATASQGRLVFGWNGFVPEIHRSIYHLATRPLSSR